MKIYDEKRAFLLPSFGGAGVGSHFCSPPSGGLGWVPVSAPLLRRGWGRLPFLLASFVGAGMGS